MITGRCQKFYYWEIYYKNLFLADFYIRKKKVQSSFRANCSTVTALIKTFSNLRHSARKGLVKVLLDLSATFDTGDVCAFVWLNKLFCSATSLQGYNLCMCPQSGLEKLYNKITYASVVSTAVHMCVCKRV